MNEIRQGDVLLRPIEKPSKVGKAVSKHRVTLAYGETTGHAHVIEGAVAEFNIDGNRVVWVEADASLTHGPDGRQIEIAPEHQALPIMVGWYVVEEQRQYTPQAIQRVID